MVKYKLSKEAELLTANIDKLSKTVPTKICNISVLVLGVLGTMLAILAIISQSEYIGMLTLKTLILDIVFILVSGFQYSVCVLKYLHDSHKKQHQETL